MPITKPIQYTDVVHLIDDREFSHKEVIIASGAGLLAIGSVLGKVTATGKYVLANATKSDGSQTPVAILAVNVDATSVDVNATAIVYEAVVKSDALTWDASFDATKQATAISGLETSQRIIVRATV